MIRRLCALLLVTLISVPSLAVFAQEATPNATPGSLDSGPVSITGTVFVANFEDELAYTEPTVALLDITEDLPIETPDFSPNSGQILGYPTSPLFVGSTPGTYRVDLPIAPTGGTLDLNYDGTPDGGVQAYQLIIASNILGDSYLQQEEQTAGRRSILRDVLTGRFLEGSLLIYAADENQSFPTGYGDDKAWFTADDALSPIDQGYSVVYLSPDGSATIDRSAAPAMDALAQPAAASPDFSSQGILESYNSLIDQLKMRYAFTEFRQIDWDAVKAQYLPRVEQADAAQDMSAYYQILTELASGVHDAHVQVAPVSQDAVPYYIASQQYILSQIGGTLGASTAALSDPDDPNGPTDNVVIVTLGEGSPLADAGIVPGTQIVSVDGVSVTDRLDQIPDWYLGTFSTQEKALANKSQILLRFPDGAEVTLEYRLPGETETKTGTFTAGQFPLGNAATPQPVESISFSNVDGYTVIQVLDFDTNFAAKIAVLEEALKYEQQQAAAGESKGIILDVRGNGGGWDLLYMAMASYFYTADNPEPRNVFDIYQYDDATGQLEKQYSPDYMFSSPQPDLAYSGPLYVLIDQFCGSSCEFFAQTLQKTERAAVIGQYASEGAGGNVDRIMMPSGILFQYTVGRSYYAGTDELNIEGKGVTPDIRLPITLESQTALYTGQDLVLTYTVAYLDAISAAAAATPAASPAAGEATPSG